MISTATRTSVASSATPVLICEGNPGRSQVIIVNDSSQVLYLIYLASDEPDDTGSTDDYTLQLPDNTNGTATLVEDKFKGKITGFWADTDGSAFVTEI